MTRTHFTIGLDGLLANGTIEVTRPTHIHALS